MKIYLAGPSFTSAERIWNSVLASNLQMGGMEVYMPQRFGKDVTVYSELARLRLTKIRECDILVVNSDGTDVDSGTSMEFGYAISKGIKTIAYRTDSRRAGDSNKNVTLMISEMADAFVNKPLASYSEVGRAVLGFIHRLGETR